MTIENYFSDLENVLLYKSKLASVATHKTILGNIREDIIHDFLLPNLGKNVSIGDGEIIDSSFQSNRNQYDIVISKSNYPKVHLTKETAVFLIESVISTIEVKSKLTKDEYKKSVVAANNCKKLKKKLNY